MTNRDIRGQAWKLFGEHNVRFVPPMAILSMLLLAAELMDKVIVRAGTLRASVVSLLVILFAPVTQCGAAVLARSALMDKTPGLDVFFQPLRNFRTVANIWLTALVYVASSVLVSLVSAAIPLFISAYIPAESAKTVNLWMMVLLYLPLVFIGFWVSLRLMLFPYAFARHPQQEAGQWLSASWNAMRGECGRLIRLTLSTGWPLFLVMVLAIPLSRAAGLQTQPAESILQMTILAAFMCFYFGYPLLALAGFAEEILDEYEGVRKPGRKKRVK